MHFQDEPVHNMSALVGYSLMELARTSGTTVVLNGQGADETLAGYSTYFQDYWFTLVEMGERARAVAELKTFAHQHGADPAALQRGLARRLAFSRVGRLPGYRPVANAAGWALAHSPWFSRGLVRAARSGTTQSGGLGASLRTAVTSEPLPVYLRVEDRNSMAHSVEVRVPFLDARLVSFAMRLPPDWKIRGPWNKYVLREAMRGRIPESVRARSDKMGFPTPSPKWFANELYEPLRDLLASRAARERGFYRCDRLLRALDARRGKAAEFDWPLFRIAQFEQWCAMVAARSAA